MSAQLVIFDNQRRGDTIEIAREEGCRAGFAPQVFDNPLNAYEAVGFDTKAVIAASGPHMEYGYPLDAAQWIEVPRAVLLQGVVADPHEQSYVEDETLGILLPRNPEELMIRSLRTWLESLKAA